ncbi:alpha/beta hydrolase [Rhodococcus sp. NPDC004095]
MTTTDSDLNMQTQRLEATPVYRVVDVDGIPMSALVAEAANPRAVILALHGGATDSGYFDCPGHPRYSLLRTGAALGYTVVAIDRPGYGASAPHADEVAPPQRRVDLAYGAVDRILGGSDRGAGMFVWAHSVGCELGTRIAADDRGRHLVGLELSGTGREHQPRAHSIFRSSERNAAPSGVRELLWKPEHLYPRELLGGGPIGSATPSYETEVVGQWPRTNFPELAAQVHVPVHFTAGEHERVWRNDPEALRAIATQFVTAPRVETRTQLDGGHNLSLGHTAPAYHLNVLSFVEECVAGLRHGTSGAPASGGTTRPREGK